MKRKNLASIVLGTALMTVGSFAGASGACGAGKCGGNMKKAKESAQKAMPKGSCGAGMKAKKAVEDANKTIKDAADANKTTAQKGACGAGKCGGNMGKK